MIKRVFFSPLALYDQTCFFSPLAVSARVITFQTLCPYVIPVNVHAGEHRIEECLLVHKLHAYDYDGLDGVGDPLSLHVYGCALRR
jgi:hypothetical protein